VRSLFNTFSAALNSKPGFQYDHMQRGSSVSSTTVASNDKFAPCPLLRVNTKTASGAQVHDGCSGLYKYEPRMRPPRAKGRPVYSKVDKATTVKRRRLLLTQAKTGASTTTGICGDHAMNHIYYDERFSAWLVSPNLYRPPINLIGDPPVLVCSCITNPDY
jgi:hypothetical protein